MQDYRCWAEVDLAALRENLAALRARAGPGVRLLTVVKADAYGHGLKPIAGVLMQSGTDIFGVANLAEARAIRSVGKGWPILMLGATLPFEMEAAVRDGIRPTLSSRQEAEGFAEEARRQQRAVKAHLKVDTGMGRLGAPCSQAAELAVAISKMNGLELEGVYTHLANAEEDPEFSARQVRRFSRVLAQIRRAGLQIPDVHCANSAGLLHRHGTHFNLARPGLLVYGITPGGAAGKALENGGDFHPALSFHCRIGFIKKVPKGASISYGRTYVAPRAARIATLTAGYGDGLPRAGSNLLEVLIRGRRCPVRGRITMDQAMVDVSQIPDAAAGDPVVLIGRQGGENITVNEIAQRCGTVPWAILTGISYRVPRIYRGSHAA